jgi:chromate transporter
MNPFTLFLYMFRAALLSTGGFGNVSSLHNEFVPKHLATDAQFVEALTVGQVSPGPNGLWVVSLGYLMLGPWGSVAALIAILLPPCLVIVVDRLYSRVQHHPAVEGFLRGLMLAVIGTFVTVLCNLLRHSGLDAPKLILTIAAFGLGWFPRIPVALIIALCGMAGFLIYR